MSFTLDSPFGATMATNSAGLAEGTNDHTIKTVAADGTTYTNYMINGYLYAKADTDNIAVTACAQQAVSTSCLYLVSINSSGTVTTTKGDEVATADLTAGTAVLNWPAVPANTCPLGGFKIATDASTTFTAGTTDHGAAGITDTYYNFGTVPATPITS